MTLPSAQPEITARVTLSPSVAQVMLNAIETAKVGVLLLDQHFLRKKCPFAELRTIMALDKALPILFGISHDEFEELIDELIQEVASSQPHDQRQRKDIEMLQTLKRITMLLTADQVSDTHVTTEVAPFGG